MGISKRWLEEMSPEEYEDWRPGEVEVTVHSHGCYCGEGYALCDRAGCDGQEKLVGPCCEAETKRVREEAEAIEAAEKAKRSA